MSQALKVSQDHQCTLPFFKLKLCSNSLVSILNSIWTCTNKRGKKYWFFKHNWRHALWWNCSCQNLWEKNIDAIERNPSKMQFISCLAGDSKRPKNVCCFFIRDWLQYSKQLHCASAIHWLQHFKHAAVNRMSLTWNKIHSMETTTNRKIKMSVLMLSLMTASNRK